DEIGDRMFNYILIAFEICIYIVALALLLINRRRTRLRELYDYTELTCRYQLAENIRACRLLMTFVLFDSLITVADIIGDVGFNFSTGFELAIPWALAILGHESYRNRLRRILCLRVGR
ncbi:hypothetical protein PENTCL1PPCAC_1961, partial [Pristionchus entomophagus]